MEEEQGEKKIDDDDKEEEGPAGRVSLHQAGRLSTGQTSTRRQRGQLAHSAIAPCSTLVHYVSLLLGKGEVWMVSKEVPE